MPKETSTSKDTLEGAKAKVRATRAAAAVLDKKAPSIRILEEVGIPPQTSLPNQVTVTRYL